MNPEIITGGLYAEKLRDGPGYMVVKVLKVDFAVHVMMFKEDFPELPAGIKSSQLKIALGHAPMSAEGWAGQHILVGREEVTEDELFGYRVYMGE